MRSVYYQENRYTDFGTFIEYYTIIKNNNLMLKKMNKQTNPTNMQEYQKHTCSERNQAQRATIVKCCIISFTYVKVHLKLI